MNRSGGPGLPTGVQANAPRAPVEGSDAELVAKARAGAPGAEEALFRRHAPRMLGLARRLLGRDDEVEDLVQDAFLAALRSLRKLAEPEAFGPWLNGIVVNRARNLLRRRRMLGRLGLLRTESVTDDLPVAAGAPPDVAAELRRVADALRGLPPEERIALILRRVEGCTVPEIAALMQVSESTVKRRLEGAERLFATVEAP